MLKPLLADCLVSKNELALWSQESSSVVLSNLMYCLRLLCRLSNEKSLKVTVKVRFINKHLAWSLRILTGRYNNNSYLQSITQLSHYTIIWPWSKIRWSRLKDLFRLSFLVKADHFLSVDTWSPHGCETHFSPFPCSLPHRWVKHKFQARAQGCESESTQAPHTRFQFNLVIPNFPWGLSPKRQEL